MSMDTSRCSIEIKSRIGQGVHGITSLKGIVQRKEGDAV
jgi:hypothetical protein